MKSYLPASKEEALIVIKKAEVAVSGRSKFEDRPSDDYLSMVALSIGLISIHRVSNGIIEHVIGRGSDVL